MSAAAALWAAANVPGWAAYRLALRDPRRIQEAHLRALLERNAASAFGRLHGFAEIRDIADYQRRVPLQSWADVQPWVDRIAGGETGVLTSEPVLLLESTGGSTSSKQVPSTRSLQAEMRAAVAPWVTDLHLRRPGLARGRAYWSISPAIGVKAAGAAVPVGFEDDAAYLGGRWQRLVTATLAVPAAVRHVTDLTAFRYATLLFLLHARDLVLVSVWHPSFFTLLLDALAPNLEQLIRDVHDGTLTPPVPLSPALQATLGSRLRARPARAREVERIGPRAAPLWPRLRLVSCWGDGHAGQLLPALQARLPGVEIQPKGLLATEGCVTIPFAGTTPLAVRSHVFEFLDGAGVHLVDDLEPGRQYSVVLTTGGGLYRYRLGDRVEVTGRLARTPTLRFLGKEDHVADLVGEKLDEGFVARCLANVLASVGEGSWPGPAFALLAPDRTASPAGYTLYVDGLPMPRLAARVDAALAGRGDYRYARELGQLAPVRLFRIRGSGSEEYLDACRRAGQRLGDIKPLALSRRDDWSSVFPGGYVDA